MWISFTKRLALVGVLLCGVLNTAPAHADALVSEAKSAPGELPPSSPLPRQLDGAEIVDKLGAKVPLDVKMRRHDGTEVLLSDVVDEGRPVLLNLAYYNCPMLCSMVINATLSALSGMKGLELGKDYRVVTLSVDPTESTKLASSKRRTYLKAYTGEGDPEGWAFYVADESEIRRLADSVGFGYKKDESTGQYAHGAGVFIISPDGVLTRTLWGLTFSPTDVKFALLEGAQGKIGSVVERIVLSCFVYHPDKQKYGVYIWGVMRLGGVLTMLIVGAILLAFWRKERRDGTGMVE